MKRVVLEQRLGFAATVCADGTPNLSPKGTTTVLDDERLLFADIHSPGTVRNLARNPAIELNVVDPIVRKGYRFKGRATLHPDGETYEEGLRVLRARGYDASRERIRTIVVVEVERAAPLVSPAYDSDASEQQVAEVWEQRVAQLRSGRRARVEDPDTGGFE
jgi:predicted pyridoxine 5'-phosphate oxidase superfamily flavin-nucleotide-binding protein